MNDSRVFGRLFALALVTCQTIGLFCADLGSAPALARRTSLASQTPGRHSPSYLQDVLPIVMGKCARCHNDQTTFLRDWLDYDAAFRDRREIKRRVWDSWRGTFFKQAMPIANSPESEGITENERRVLRDWVESGAPYGVRSISGAELSKPQKIDAGHALFSTICAVCHQPTGQGVPARFPPLAGSDFLNADKHRAIKVLLNGLQGELVVNGQKFNNSMPKFPFTDQDIANALTYVYNSFGNSGQEVTPSEVNAARAEPPDALGPAGVGRTSRPPEQKSPWE
jgi:mono/diheme cytochrome c family protein